MRYLAIVHHDRSEGPFGVTVPDLPGCFSAGDTLADALESAREAITLHIEGLLSDGEPVPDPAPTIDADGGIVAAVNVDDGLLSDRAVRLTSRRRAASWVRSTTRHGVREPRDPDC